MRKRNSLYKWIVLSVILAGCFFAVIRMQRGVEADKQAREKRFTMEVKTGQNADLVVINTGLQSNFRVGAVCSVETETKGPAKVVIVEATQKKSVGLLITNTEVKVGAAVYITAN